MPHLIAITGPVAGLVLPLSEGEQVIGREPGASLLLPDDAISRQHCRLTVDDSGVWSVHDLGSLNKTFVNGDEITESATLDDGDEIRIGETTLRFVQGESELISIVGGESPTLLVDVDALGQNKPPQAWRADRLDDLIALHERVRESARPHELLAAFAAWIRKALTPQRLAVYRRDGRRFRVVHEERSDDDAGSGSQILDADVLDQSLETGRTAWLSEAQMLVAPLGKPASYVVVSTGFQRPPAEWDVQLVAAATGLVGSTLGVLERMAILERAVDEARIVIDDETQIVTRSAAMQPALRTIERAAANDSTVLVLGESGSGKELVARAIHVKSHRAAGPFVAVNCAAIPETLIESELFGHERGAFTGATSARMGRFERAHQGTLFLDEIGEMSLPAQARLLRVLEDHTIVRVGGNDSIAVDVRVVAATNREIESMVTEGAFRKDLYYRINVLPVRLPALRERPEDVPLLAEHLLEAASKLVGRRPEGFDKEAMSLLQSYSWPGNVRELRNAVEHAVAIGSGSLITTDDLPQFLREPAPSPGDLRLPASLRDVERIAIVSALDAADGNKSQAARTLGIDRGTLYAKIKLYGIET